MLLHLRLIGIYSIEGIYAPFESSPTGCLGEMMHTIHIHGLIRIHPDEDLWCEREVKYMSHERERHVCFHRF